MNDGRSRTDTRGDDVENPDRLFASRFGALMYGWKDEPDWYVDLPEEVEEEPVELPVPTGLELTDADVAYRACPYDHLEELRTREPVHHDVTLNRFVLTRHDDVRDVLDNADLCSDRRKGNPGTFARQLADERDPLLPYRDDAAHGRLRELVGQVFSPTLFEALRPRIRNVITTILDDLEENEFEFDVVPKYTARVSMLVTCDLLGIDAALQPQFRIWANQVVGGFFNPTLTEDERRASDAARRELTTRFHAMIAARRVTPTDDLISALTLAESAGDHLSDAEIADQCMVLLAGTGLIEAFLGNGIRAMLQNTRQMTLSVEQPELRTGAIEEMLRFDAPVLSVARIANADMTIAGCPVAKGETLWASLAAANRDPAAHPEPDDFDVQRSDQHHFAFGAGAHSCLGAQLARIEAEEAIFGLIVRFPIIETSPQGWEFAQLTNLRMLKNFWIRT